MILSRFKLFIFYLIITLLPSCAKSYKINNFDKYIKTQITRDSSFDINIDIENDSYKVVIPTFSVTNSKDASDLGLDTLSTSYLSRELQKYGVSILDRAVSDKLANELSLVEMHGGVKLKNANLQKSAIPDIADFAIVGSIDEVSFSSALSDMGLVNTAANVGLALATGGRYIGGGTVVASSYDYKATVAGSISVIDLTTNKVLLKSYFSETMRDSEAAQGYGGGLITIAELKKAKDKDSGLIGDTLKSALIHKVPEIIQILSPAGYIVERRDIDNNTSPIFKISVGKNDGIIYKDKVKCIKYVENINPLTNKKDYVEQVIASGVVSNLIDQHYSWVVFDNLSDAANLQMGNKCIFTKKFKK
ncbi:MAG: hypothetical protein RL208_171 [Pseudomonadota bacterium]|jgi:hypothetical protein